MKSRQIALAISFVVCASLACSAQKSKRGEMVNPDQVAEIAEAAQQFARAERPCANYGWAAAVQTLLQGTGVTLTQDQWVTKVSGGAKCLLSVDDYSVMTQGVEGEYALGNGRRVRIRTLVQGGAPTIVDSLIVQLRAGRTYIVLWNDKAYLLGGILYDDHMRSYTSHTYLVKELRLVDPMVAPGKPGRTVVFKREKDNANEILGLIALSVTELQPGQLSEGYPK